MLGASSPRYSLANDLARVDLRNPLSPHELNLNRVAWWLAMPGRYGGPIWYDLAAGRPANLVAYGTNNAWSSYGYIQGAGSIYGYGSGINSYLSIGSPTALDLTGPVTSTCWLNAANVTGGFVIYSSYASASPYHGYGFGIGNTGTNGQLSFWCGQTAWTGAGPDVRGAWHHLGITFDGVSTATFYVDGKSVGTASTGGAITSHSGPKYLFYDGVSSYLQGYLTTFSLWSRCLPSNEIYADFAGSKKGYPGVLRRRRQPTYSLPAAAPSGVRFRKTLSGLGGRVGSRQEIKSWATL